MSVSVLCLCAIVLVFSFSCRDDAGVVQSVSGDIPGGSATEGPGVGTRPKPTESPPQSVLASRVVDTDGVAEPPVQNREPTLAAEPTVTVESPSGNGDQTHVAEPTTNNIAASGTTETVAIALPWHHYEPVVNTGIDYLYGELFESNGCLRITYLGPYASDHIPTGIWLIWPPGFTARLVDDVI